MIKVTKITVRSFDLAHLDVFWEIDQVKAGQSADLKQHEIFDYQFYVLRSEAAMGPFDVVGGPFRDPVYFFRDNRVSLINQWRSFYYKIRVVHVPSGTVAEFGPTSNDESEPDRITRAIRYEQDVLFREFIGRKCWLYPARSFGPRCSCWDPVSQRRTRSGHLPCFGTGWLGGYFSPVQCHVQIDPAPRGQVSKARLTAFPPVGKDDILIETENRRWKVDAVGTTERLRSVLHQELALSPIPPGEIQFSLPVNVDLSTLQPAAERNFTNSSALALDDGTYDDIISFYGTPRGSVD